MKVKNSSCLRSLTALRRANIKNSADKNEECDPWYVSAPSITYLWTRKPQWRRRHKNRKKSNIPRFPVLTNVRVNENDIFDTLKIIDRPISCSSTSPYETCSSRQIITESGLFNKYENEKNDCEDMTKKSNENNQEFDRKLCMSESLSDSGFWKTREPQLIRLVRSQKRIGKVGNCMNSQTTVASSCGVDLNDSVEFSFGRGLKSARNVPKRRVTFDNYVSKNCLIDKKNPTKRNDKLETRWWEEDYAGLSCEKKHVNDDDAISLQTDLSRLFSSMIFDLTSKSSVSIMSPKNSRKKSKMALKKDLSESIFYINSLCKKESSCDLLSVRGKLSIDKYFDCKESISTKYLKRKMELREKLMKSFVNDEIASDIERSLKNYKPTYQRSIECITIELKDVTSGDGKVCAESKKIIRNENHISTDTNDLFEISLLPTVGKLPTNSADNVVLRLSEIVDFFKKPEEMNTIFLEKLSAIDAASSIDCRNLNKPIGADFEPTVDKIEILRVDTETCGECESVLIEIRDLDNDSKKDQSSRKSIQSEIKSSPKNSCKSVMVDISEIANNSKSADSTKDHRVCSGSDKCCSICGRTRIDNPRYLRPVCRVKGLVPAPPSENDPWNNVIKKMTQSDSRKNFISRERKISKIQDTRSLEDRKIKLELKKDSHSVEINSSNAILSIYEKQPEVGKEEQKHCFSIFVTEKKDSLVSNTSNNSSIPPSRTQSISYRPSESEIASTSYSHDPSISRTSKTYYFRESVRTMDNIANRLLCVISESDASMGLPKFLPREPPDWIARQMPRKRWPRR